MEDRSTDSPAVLDRRPLENRVVILTGVGRGIGAALVRGLTDAGARLAVVSRTEEGCRHAMEQAPESAGQLLPITIDIGERGAAQQIVDTVMEEWGSISVLINNAGLLRPHNIDRITDEDLEQLMLVNFRAPFELCRAARLHLAQTRGSIINVSALAALRPMAGIGAYAASKAAMLAMTKTMAREWGADGIRVNALIPGSIATEMILPRDPQKQESFVAEWSSVNALGRLGTPEEMVGPVIFLASDASSYVTGQAIQADGGSFA